MVFPKISKQHRSETDSDSGGEKLDTPFPNLIVLSFSSTDSITKLSSFMVEKFLLANVFLKSVKTTKNNMLVIQVVEKSHAELLFKMTTLHNIKIKSYPHSLLDSSRGVVKCRELSLCIVMETF